MVSANSNNNNETTRPTTTPFRGSHELVTVTPSAKAVVSLLPASRVHYNEGRYWAEKLGLGSTATTTNFRRVDLQAGTASVVHQLTFGPREATSNSNNVPLATACGPRIRLYGITPSSLLHQQLQQRLSRKHNTKEVSVIDSDKQIPLGHLCMAVAFRHDGRLLAAACDNGSIKVVDRASRAVLVTWTGSRLPGRTVHWLRDGQHVLAAGDDGRVRVWTLKEPQEPVWTGTGHGDAIRCAQVWQQPPNTDRDNRHAVQGLAATGSDDHTVRIWNLDATAETDEDRCLFVLSHEAPVQAMVFWVNDNYKSDGSSETAQGPPAWLITASGTVLRVWNPWTGRLVTTCPTHHAKTLTCLLRVDRKDYGDDIHSIDNFTLHPRLLTGSLDGTLRVHRWDSTTSTSPRLEAFHSIQLANDDAVTALAAVGPERLAVGYASGRVTVRQRGPRTITTKRTRQPMSGTYAYFLRGTNVSAPTADDADVIVTTNKKRRLPAYDLALQQFRYGDALDEALATREPHTVGAVLQELGRRDGLRLALQHRDEELLEPLLAFMVRYIGRPKYTPVLLGVAHQLVELYRDVSGQSETIDELFLKLKQSVSAEVRAQTRLLRVLGQVDALLGASSLMATSGGD